MLSKNLVNNQNKQAVDGFVEQPLSSGPHHMTFNIVYPSPSEVVNYSQYVKMLEDGKEPELRRMSINGEYKYFASEKKECVN